MRGLSKYLKESLLDMGDDSFDAVNAAFDGGIIDKEQARMYLEPVDGELIIPPGAVEIGTEAFCGWETIRRVVIPASLVKIGYWAFNNCENLEEVVFPKNSKNLKVIGSGAFDDCEKLKYLDVPDSVEVAEGTVAGGVTPTEFHIPTNLRVVGDCMFSSYMGDVLDLSNTKIEGMTKYSARMGNFKKVILPESCTFMDQDAFRYCRKLEEIYAPGVMTLGEKVFDECISLRKVVLAPGASLRIQAFSNCNKLTSIASPLGSAAGKPFDKTNIEEIKWDGSGTISPSAIQYSNIKRIIITVPKDKLRTKTKNDIARILDKRDVEIVYQPE